ncbi:putative ribonuclease H-like domain-containing protein [Tanacetum coccineum]
MIEGNGPKWLFDIDSLTQSMNYVPVTAGTISNDSADDSNTKDVNVAGQHVTTASPDVNTGSLKLNVVGPSVNTASSNEHNSPKDMFTMGVSSTLEATHIESFSDEDEPEVGLGNITNSYTVLTTPNTRIHKDHPIDNVIGDVKSFVQTRRMTKPTFEQGFLSDVWILVDLPNGKMAIGTKWVFKNKKDEREIVIRNKARLVAQGNRQEEDPDHPDKVYKVVKALYGLHQAPRAWYESLANYLLGNRFKRGKIDQTLFIKKQKEIFCLYKLQQMEDGIFISQDKYVAEILKKFNYSDVKSMIMSLMYLTVTRPDIMFACKKQTVVATSTNKAIYVAAASCRGQVLWIQNQLLDYGYNLMNTVINIDNNITIYIIKNPVQHSKTKHIEIRHHFIRDCNAKKLIQMVKIHTDYNVADLLTKGFDAGRFQYLVSSIGMLNP